MWSVFPHIPRFHMKIKGLFLPSPYSQCLLL